MLETIKIKATNEDGFLVINKTDFDEKEHKEFIDLDGDGKADRKPAAKKPLSTI
jgi:hypothetical protein